MFKSKPIAAVLSLWIAFTAHGQTPQPIPDASTLGVLSETARTRAQSALEQIPTRPGAASTPKVDMDRINALGGGADPLEIARRYQQQLNGEGRQAEVLYIFVSASMGVEPLIKLARQAKAAGATMVLRGIKGGFKGYAQLVKELEPVLATGVDLQIHPELFDRFNVTAVPTFVIAQAEEGCVGNACNAEAISVVGDVSVPYALDHLATQAHPLAKVASRLRQRFR